MKCMICESEIVDGAKYLTECVNLEKSLRLLVLGADSFPNSRVVCFKEECTAQFTFKMINEGYVDMTCVTILSNHLTLVFMKKENEDEHLDQ